MELPDRPRFSKILRTRCVLSHGSRVVTEPASIEQNPPVGHMLPWGVSCQLGGLGSHGAVRRGARVRAAPVSAAISADGRSSDCCPMLDPKIGVPCVRVW